MAYFEYNTLSQTLIPVTRQMAQAISTGDEIALQRISDSLILIPHISNVQVYLADGTCAAESERDADRTMWNSDIKEPCRNKQRYFQFSIERSIQLPDASVDGIVHLGLEIPLQYFLIIPLSFFFIILTTNIFIRVSVQKTVLSLAQMIEQLASAFYESDNPNFELEEINHVYQKLKRLRSLELDVATNTSLQKATSQVSHDIRSPLAALEMILPELTDLSEDKRLIVRNSVNRIRDIANDLLKKYREDAVNQFQKKGNLLQIELLLPLIDEIVSEKRTQYKNLVFTEISFTQSMESYGHFSRVNSIDFKRMLSNLINNAVEALPRQKGKVSVELRSLDNQWIEINVKDNGIGISRDNISKIGTKGLTTKKDGGSGLGLYNAKELIASWNGDLKIESVKGNGSNFMIRLEKAETPSWFVPKINLNRESTVISFDDDSSVHKIWRTRIDSFGETSKNIILRSFLDPAGLMDYYRNNFVELENALFLIDYEILGTAHNGLDIIERLGIQASSILVTSRYDQPEIRERCQGLQVKLIPKSMSGFVPIEIL